MASAGTDRNTGRVLTDFDHVLQCLDVIFTTPRGSRVMRGWLFAGLSEILGRRLTPRLISIYATLLSLAIRTYEPRLQVVSVRTLDNTVEGVRLGALSFEILVNYRPRGHLGDLTVEGGLRRFSVGSNPTLTGLVVSALA